MARETGTRKVALEFKLDQEGRGSSHLGKLWFLILFWPQILQEISKWTFLIFSLAFCVLWTS